MSPIFGSLFGTAQGQSMAASTYNQGAHDSAIADETLAAENRALEREIVELEAEVARLRGILED